MLGIPKHVIGAWSGKAFIRKVGVIESADCVVGKSIGPVIGHECIKIAISINYRDLQAGIGSDDGTQGVFKQGVDVGNITQTEAAVGGGIGASDKGKFGDVELIKQDDVARAFLPQQITGDGEA